MGRPMMWLEEEEVMDFLREVAQGQNEDLPGYYEDRLQEFVERVKARAQSLVAKVEAEETKERNRPPHPIHALYKTYPQLWMQLYSLRVIITNDGIQAIGADYGEVCDVADKLGIEGGGVISIGGGASIGIVPQDPWKDFAKKHPDKLLPYQGKRVAWSRENGIEFTADTYQDLFEESKRRDRFGQVYFRTA